MKLTILYASLICFCCASSLGVEASQKKKSLPQRQAGRPQARVSLDGNWTGKTGQNKSITFTVLNGRITGFSGEGRFAGDGCTSTSSTRTTVDEQIVNNAFSIVTSGGPGGISFKINGTFTSATMAEGVASMQLQPALGPPPGIPGVQSAAGCGGSLRTTWTAWKGDQPPTPEMLAAAKRASDAKKGRASLVELISPMPEETLDNGCDNLKKEMTWEFKWSETPGAQAYHLYVIHELASNPVIDDSTIKSASFTYRNKGFIARKDLEGWMWKVRPMLNGAWKDWTGERSFNVKPGNTDCIAWEASLSQAIEKGDAPRVKELLTQGWGSLKNADREHRTPLIRAAQAGLVEIVRLLVAAGADVNWAPGMSDPTALMIAARDGRLEIVQILLEAGASVNRREFGADKTALYYAADKGRVEIVTALLKKGANPNGVDRSNQDAHPLLAAIQTGNTEIVRALLDAGASPNVGKTNWNSLKTETALQMAQSKNLSEIVRLLRQHGARD